VNDLAMALLGTATLWAVWRCWTLGVWLIPILFLLLGALTGALMALAGGKG